MEVAIKSIKEIEPEGLNETSKEQAKQAKPNKWGYINLKSFFTAKEMINKMKRQPTQWEKMFASHTSDEGLKCKIYKLHIQLNDNNNNNNNSNSHHYHLIQEWTKDLTRYTQRKYSNGKLIHVNVLSITKHQGMPIKTTMKYHPTPIRIDIIKKTRDNRCCQGYEEKRTLLEVILTGTTTMEKKMEVPAKSKK